MNWKRCNFLKHYKKVRIQGSDPERLINMCLIKKLNMRKIRYSSDNEVSFYISHNDYEELKALAGRRYIIEIAGEYGYRMYFAGLFKRPLLLTGLVIFISIFVYQSLFISEIEVIGYESINEQALRKSMREAGFYEGCRKNIDIEKLKLHIYEEFDNIAWIGIKYKGNLAQITIVETDYIFEKKKIDTDSPCNIVAAVSGYINSIDPQEGVRVMEDGAYVEQGEVIISGEVPLEKTTFSEQEEETVSYVHAAGTVDAKVPVRLNYCIEANEYLKNKTGRRMVLISVNDRMLFRELCPYELSKIKCIDIIDWVKPVKLNFQVNIIEEVEIIYRKKSEAEIKKHVVNHIHEFVEEKLPYNTQILNKSLNFRQEKNIIYIGVTLETLQEIGKEEEIIVDKSNRQSDQNDD